MHESYQDGDVDASLTIEIPDRAQRLWTVEFMRAPLSSRREPLTFAVQSVATLGEKARHYYWGIHDLCERLWPANDIAPRSREERETWYLHGIVRACRRSFDEILAQEGGDYERVLRPEDVGLFVKASTGDFIDLFEWEIEEMLIGLASLRGSLETHGQQGGAPLGLFFSFPEGWKVHKALLRKRRDAGERIASVVYPSLDEFDREYAQLSALDVIPPPLMKQVLEHCGLVNVLGHIVLQEIAAARAPREEAAGEPSHDEAWPQDRSVHIHGLVLNNLRCFQEHHLELAPPEDELGQWIVLLGASLAVRSAPTPVRCGVSRSRSPG